MVTWFPQYRRSSPVIKKTSENTTLENITDRLYTLIEIIDLSFVQNHSFQCNNYAAVCHYNIRSQFIKEGQLDLHDSYF